MFFDPLRKKAKAGEFVFVASLTALPEDGLPRKFPVIAGHTDAWNKFPPAPVGAVYLRRTGKTVEALNVVCPHAGCFVDFNSETKSFLCPCHNSTFALNGKISDPSSPSPRAMDKLSAQIRNGTEVWVKFQNFQAGEPRQMTGRPFDTRKAAPPATGISNNDYAANFADFLDAAPKDQPWSFWYGAFEPHRGYAEAAAILGEDYAGFLVHDGARCFTGLRRRFTKAAWST